MELSRPCLFFYLLAILLSLSISLTTNSDPTNAETLQWKGGDGVKRSRVRRQNLHLKHALHLPEKAYTFYMLWRILNEIYNDTDTIKPLMTRPDKLEFTTPEGPKNMEIEVKPSSPRIQEQSTHSTGMTGTNNPTAMPSFPTHSLPDSQKTTRLEDLQLVGQSTQRLQTTLQQITEFNQAIEQHIPDSTTFKIPTTASEEPSTIAIHEQIDHFSGINSINNSTAIASFPTHSSLPDSQETTQSGDSQLAEESTQRLQTTVQKITEPSEVTEQHIPDSTTFTIKNFSKASEEPSSIAIHEQIDHFSGINSINNSTAKSSFTTHSSLPDAQKTSESADSQLAEESTQRLQTTIQKIPSIHEQTNHFTGSNGTKNSTAMLSLPTQSSFPDSQETTQSRDSQLAEESTQRLQTTIQKIIEPNQVTEQHIPDSTTFTIKNFSKAAEEPSSITINEQIDHFTNGINNSTAMASFPTHSSLPDSQETTQSRDSQLAEESAQHFQTTIQKIIEPSQVTEQHIPDSTTFTIKNFSKAAEEPSSIPINEQIDHFTANGINKSTAMASFPTHSSLPDAQETTQSRDSQLVEESTQRLQTTVQKIPSIHEQTDHFTGSNGRKNSTAMLSLPTQSSLPDSQETTQSRDSQPVEESTQRLQTTIQKIIEPSEVTEQHIPDSTTFTIKNFSKAAEEPSSIPINEQIDHFTANGINKSTAMASFPTHSSLPDAQETTQSRDSQLVEESTQRLQTTIQKIIEPSQVTEQHIPDSTTFTIKNSSKAAEEHSSITLHEQIDHFTGSNGTNNSTAMVALPTQSSFPDSQETTQSRDSQLVEESTERLQTTIQKIIEPSQVTEQHIPDSTTFTIKNFSKAAEEPSSIAINEQINNFTANGINNSTAMASFPNHSSLPDAQETTQSGDSQLAEESSQRLQTTIQNIPSIHEQIDHFTASNGTKNSTAMVSLPTQSSFPDSQETTQSRDSQLAEQSAQHFQTTIQKIIEPSQVTEQHIPDSTTFTIKNSLKAAEEPSSITIHEQIDNFTANGINKSTAMASFPTHSSLPDAKETTQSGDSQLAEESTQRFHRTKQKIPEPIIRSIGTNGTNYSTPIMSFLTDRPPQESQKNTQSGAPQLLEHSTQHFQSPKHKMTESSQTIGHLIAITSTPNLATTYRIQQETLLQSAIDPHIPNNDILASTMENNNLQPTPLPQITKDEYPKMTPFINRLVQSISKFTPPARTKQTTLLTVNPEIIKNPPHTLSVTWQNGKPNWLVTATAWRVSKRTPPTFTLKQQIKHSTSLLLTPKTIKKNTQKPANDSLVSRKMASTSPLPILIENHFVDSEGPEDTSVSTGISLQDSTSFRTYPSNAKTQSQSTTNKYTIFHKMMSHTSFPLVKDTSTQAPTDGVQLSQTIPVSTEKLVMMFTLNPRPSEKHIHTTSIVRNGLLKSRTQEIPSLISTIRSNIHPTETTEFRLDPTNQRPTADSMPKENYSNNDLLTEMEKPTQSMSGRKPSSTTRSATTRLHVSKTQTVSQKPHDTKAPREIFVLLFSFGCLVLLIIVILLWVVWKKWQARHWRNNMWVAGSPLPGTYHSVLQNSSSYTAIQMRNKYSQKKKQENSDFSETIALKQQHKDLVYT